MSETVAELRALTEGELIERHDHHAKTTVVGTQHYWGELNRRNQERQTEVMLGFTRWITRMTMAITIATLVNVGIAVGVLVIMMQG